METLRNAACGDALASTVQEARRELGSFAIPSGGTAWDIFTSFIPHFRAMEVQIREDLTTRYRNTDFWASVLRHWSIVDIETTAVLRSALRLYTTDHFFSYFNALWRSGTLAKVAGYGTLLRRSFSVARLFQGTTVFRGMEISDLESYESGLVYQWPFFISASADERAAQRFGSALFVIEVPRERPISDISHYSVCPHESEVLFHPYTEFEVVSKTTNRVTVRISTRETGG